MDSFINQFILIGLALFNQITPTLIVALIALAVALKNYRRKSNTLVYGTFHVSWDAIFSQHFVSAVKLENCKDRPLILYAIYIRIGLNHYIEIEDFSAEPLVIKAYETLERSYDPILFYTDSIILINAGPLLLDEGKRKKIVLSTSQGRYVVPTLPKIWSVVSEKFKNPLVQIARPARIFYQGRALGDRIEYIVEIRDGDKIDVKFLTRNAEAHFPPGEIEFGNEVLKDLDSVQMYHLELQKRGAFPITAEVRVLSAKEIINRRYPLVYKEKIFQPNIEQRNFVMTLARVVFAIKKSWKNLLARKKAKT